MAGHSGLKRPPLKSVAVNEMAPLARRAAGKGEDAFVGAPAPLRTVRKTSGFADGLRLLLDTADEFQRMRAALQATRLESETARAMSRKKWLPHDIRKAQALQHVASRQMPSRTAAAWEIVEFMQQTFNEPIAWKTAYKWLPPVGRRRAVK